MAGISTPSRLVTSRDDSPVNPQANTVHAHDLIPGHWSWIHVARNDPCVDGAALRQWLAGQGR